MRKEIWKPIPLCEGFYDASNLGRIRRAKPGIRAFVGKILHNRAGRNGYIGHTLCFKGRCIGASAHVLVADAFIGKRPHGYDVNHKNSIRTDNRAENLEYCTRRGNVNYAFGRSINSEELFNKCLHCGAKYSVHPHRKDIAKYCCKKCADLSRVGKCGEGVGNWRGGKIAKNCVICNNVFSVIPSRAKESKLCSLECRYQLQRISPSPRKGKTYKSQNNSSKL